MKKLMIAAAIVCAAAMAQASQFKWTASGVKGYNTDDKYTGAAVLTVLDADGNSVGTWDGYMSEGTIYTDSTLATKGVIVGNEGKDAGPILSGKTYSAYYTMKDSAGNTFDSGIKSNLNGQDSGTTSVSFLAKGSWTAAPVPEPTSGLLLLLGVAGLALKRKHA